MTLGLLLVLFGGAPATPEGNFDRVFQLASACTAPASRWAALADLLGDADPNVRTLAAEGLGAMGPEGRVARDHLARTLKDEDPGVQAAAEWAWERLGAPERPPSGPALTQPELCQIRELLTRRLRKWKNPDARWLLGRTEHAPCLIGVGAGPRIGLWLASQEGDGETVELTWRQAGTYGPAFSAGVGASS